MWPEQGEQGGQREGEAGRMLRPCRGSQEGFLQEVTFQQRLGGGGGDSRWKGTERPENAREAGVATQREQEETRPGSS
jgi:hypothetical protein